MTQPPAGSLSAQGGPEDAHSSADALEGLVERLKQKMEQNPNDGVGWGLLARSYVGLGRYAEAASIYERAVTLIPDDAQLLADYADTLGVVHGRKLEGKPEVLIQQALKIDPLNVKALMLAGTVAFHRKNFARAAKDWEQARANLPADVDPEMTQQLTAAIEEARSQLGGGQSMMSGLAEPAAPAQPAGQAARNQGHGGDGAQLGRQGITDGYIVCVCTRNEWPTHAGVDRAGVEKRFALHVSAR